jgi:hypothetical protein
VIGPGVAFVLLLLSGPATAGELPQPKTQPQSPTGSTHEAQRLQEANRVLDEELKLAARPQIYLVLDLPDRVLLVKNRGLELHRVAILQAQASDESHLSRTFKLQARPPVSRPKAAAGEDPSEPVIGLEDMPAEYGLTFEPGLLVSVSPPAREQPWLWVRSRLREWGHRLAAWARTNVMGHPGTPIRIRLTMAKEDARSLAWSVVEGMPLVVHNAAFPKREVEGATRKTRVPKESGERALHKPKPPSPPSSPPKKVEELTHSVEPPAPPTTPSSSEETPESIPEPTEPTPPSLSTQ